MGALEQKVIGLESQVIVLQDKLNDAIHLISILQENIHQRDDEILELRQNMMDLRAWCSPVEDRGFNGRGPGESCYNSRLRFG
jgi:hypothetical protein